MKNLLLILFAGLLSAQSLQPQVGIHYMGGLSYDMEQEPIGVEAGLLYTLKKPSLVMSSVGVNYNYYYNLIPEKPGNYYGFYIAKIQFSKEIAEHWNFTYYAGYANKFDNNLMQHFDGPYKTNLSYGFGFQIAYEYITGEILYESVAGYPHLSVGIKYNITDLLKKKY